MLVNKYEYFWGFTMDISVNRFTNFNRNKGKLLQSRANLNYIQNFAPDSPVPPLPFKAISLHRTINCCLQTFLSYYQHPHIIEEWDTHNLCVLNHCSNVSWDSHTDRALLLINNLQIGNYYLFLHSSLKQCK